MNLTDNSMLFIPMALLLGFRHGLDADHLATIDGLTRFNAMTRPILSRWSGLLFSLGHGGVVMTVILLIKVFLKDFAVPEWLDVSGNWISISFLLLLGVANIVAVLNTRPEQVVSLISFRSRFLTLFMNAQHPATILVIGALFALSFDTVSQAAVFGLAASTHQSGMLPVLLGFAFTLGMAAADSVNGIWIAAMIRHTNRRARVASRVMGLTLGGMSLLIGLFGIGKACFAGISVWAENKEVIFGLSVIIWAALSYLWAMVVTRPALTLSHCAPLPARNDREP